VITDPAWFYSSLAQASAAIVGLMGGILTARLSDHLALKRRERGELMPEVRNVQQHFISQGAHLVKFRAFLRAELALDLAAIQGGTVTRPASAEEIGWTFTRGGVGRPIRVADDKLQREAELHVVDAVLPLHNELSDRITTNALLAKARRLRTAGGEEVAREVAKLEELAPKVQRFSDSVLPRSFLAVVVLLAWLAGVGVVWPLSVLPGIAGQPWMGKMPMLLAFAAGLIGLLIYLAAELIGIWQLGVIGAPTREELGL